MDHSHSHSQEDTMPDHSGHTMAMYFVNSIHTTILFEAWTTHTVEDYILALVGCCLAGFLSTTLKYIKNHMEYYLNEKFLFSKNVTKIYNFPIYHNSTKMIVGFFVILFDYCLMLVAMTFNVGIILSISLGIALGYFIYGVNFYPRFSIDKATIATDPQRYDSMNLACC